MECRNPALFLAGEAANVIAALRSNLKFNRYAAQDDELEDPLLEDFKALRRKLFAWQRAGWEEVDPLEYLAPFLDTVKSPETSGPITLVALAALHKIIARGILGASGGGSPAEAIQAVADGVTQCKFEATYPASDECVLHRILDVLVAVVGCPAGPLLTNDNLINIFQACYRIGHYQTEKGRDTSELLTQASRQSMAEMVHTIFSRLDAIPEPLDSPFAAMAPPGSAPPAARLQVSPIASRATLPTDGDGGGASDTEAGTASQAGEVGGEPSGALDDAAASVAASAVGAESSAADSTTEPAAAAAPAAAAEEGAEVEGASAAAAAEAGVDAEESSEAAAASPAVVSLLPAIAAGTTELEGYGVEAVREVLLFIISLIASAPVGAHQDLPAHGLDLMSTALQAAGPALGDHDSLLVLLQQDLVRAMFAAARHPSLPTLTGVCEVALGLYVHLGPAMLLQVEALLGLLLLPLAEGRAQGASAGGAAASAAAGLAPELQQAALEGVLDFCCQPGFVRDAYLNLDCRIERSNLFEQLCGLLSKAAFPVSGGLHAVHLQSLDGILAILTSLADGCSGVSDLDVAHLAPLADPAAYLDIWGPLSRGANPPLELLLGGSVGGAPPPAADLARVEKFLKGRLAAAAEHFNRDQKKGFAYLQSLKLLPAQLEPGAVARFLRCCPGLAKASIGEVLGEREPFYEEVRTAFMQTFDFTGMDFDLALRMFMDSFRPPGEGQKIDRIMQVFGRRYYEQMLPGMGLRSADACYVLAFSVIMLNTDLHNTQNKKKMTLDDFARINRSTNEGEPMPRPLLEGIYASISRDELKISAESTADELPSVFWYQLAAEARRPRGRLLLDASTNEALERDVFGLVWGPTLAAVSVVLDNTSEAGVVRRALDCLVLSARMAAFHQVDEVVDTIAASLAKYGGALHPGPRGAAAFGEAPKARMALEALFAIANRYGDWLRSGWRNVLDVVHRLHRLDLLPAAAIAGDGEDPEEARARLPRPPSFGKAKGSSGSLFSRAITSLISIEGSGDGAAAEAAAAREAAAVASAAATVEACHVDEIFADSKFLTGESLVDLVKAVMWSAGNVAGAARSGEATAPAELCLELLVALALRNRDRVGLIWPLLHEFLAACTVAENAPQANPLVERAVMGLLRICHRLLPYKEDTAETLLRSLQLIIGLSPAVAWELAEPIALELLALLKSSAPYVRSEADWRTVCALIKLTSVRPEAAPLAYESLSVAISSPGALSGDSYLPLLETCLQYLERYKQGSVEGALKYLDLVDALATWLVAQGQRQGGAGAGAAQRGPDDEPALSDEALVDLWLTSVGVLARSLAKDECQPLRDSALMALSRVLVASEALQLPPELWVQTLRELLVPVVADLARLAAAPKQRSHPGAEKSVRLAVSMLVKTVLQYVEVVQQDKDFYALWEAVLKALQDCMAARHEAVQESVPENCKNMLLVLASAGILTPAWRDVGGRSLWDLTFSKVHTISSGLNPGMLEATLAPRHREPLPPPAAAAAAVVAGAAGAEQQPQQQPEQPQQGVQPQANGVLEPAADTSAAGVGGSPKDSAAAGVPSHPISLQTESAATAAASEGGQPPQDTAASAAGGGRDGGAGEPSLSVQSAAAVAAADSAAAGAAAGGHAGEEEDEAAQQELAEQSSSGCKQS